MGIDGVLLGFGQSSPFLGVQGYRIRLLAQAIRPLGLRSRTKEDPSLQDEISTAKCINASLPGSKSKSDALECMEHIRPEEARLSSAGFM